MKHIHLQIERFERDDRVILRDTDITISEWDRLGLIGPNGAGKSTFLGLLTGQIPLIHGNRESFSGLEFATLEQVVFDDEWVLVRDELEKAFSNFKNLERQIDLAHEKMVDGSDDGGEYSTLIERYSLLGGYSYHADVDRVARWIGIFELLSRPLLEISGWERTKVALAKILLSKPEFLLLDEPTNFIDIDALLWLEEYLSNEWKWGFLIISHDRTFLDVTTTETLVVNEYSQIVRYHGNYTRAKEERDKQYGLDLKKYEEQTEFLKSEKDLINRFRAGSRAWFAKSREKMLERVEVLDRPQRAEWAQFVFAMSEITGNKLIELEDAFIGRKDPLFFIRQAILTRGEHIGIVGENGVGKSTLIRTLLGEIPVLDGIVKVNPSAQIAYFSQMHEELTSWLSVYELFEKHGLATSHSQLAGLLGGYGIGYNDLSKPLKEFSGWERAKISFALLGHHPSSLLILDEPTNHLDILSRESLEKALSKYEWSILFISHDRYFANAIAEKLWIIEDGDLVISYGNYDDYLYKKEHGLSYDMSLVNIDKEAEAMLIDELGEREVERLKKKFGNRKK
jgi:ATP-binding cassette subfamily F protein 3